MLLVQHYSDLEGPEQAARHQCSVCQGGREEETGFGRRGDSGENGEGLSGLHQSPSDGHLVQIPGSDLYSGGLRLAVGGRETLEGAE